MDQIKIMQYQSAVVAFLILYLFFVPTPIFFKMLFLFLIIIIVAFHFSKNLSFSAFVSVTLVAITYIFLENGGKRMMRVEGFEGGDEGKSEVNEKGVDDSDDEMLISNSNMAEPGKVTDIGEMNGSKMSGMNLEREDGDIFGKINMDDLEDSDEDSDEGENEEHFEKEVGKTKVSGKQAFRAQKQLYDLTSAVKTLEKTMEHLTPTLKKGQKVIEKMQSLGIDKFL